MERIIHDDTVSPWWLVPVEANGDADLQHETAEARYVWFSVVARLVV
jgi:hypothetical protein